MTAPMVEVTAPMVEVKNVSKYFGSVIALRDISTSVRAGEERSQGRVVPHREPPVFRERQDLHPVPPAFTLHDLPEALPEELAGAPGLDELCAGGRAPGRGATGAEQVGCGCHCLLTTRAVQKKARSSTSTGGKYKTRYLRSELATA